MKRLLTIAAILGMLSVILGAFGAHALRDLITDTQLASYKTGVAYHQFHTIAMLGTAILGIQFNNNKWFYRAGIGFFIGILLFSGSIYLLSTRDLIGIGELSWLGPITPIGGLVLICSWILLLLGAIKYNNERNV